MEIKFPESSSIQPPHKIEGDMRSAKESFFEMAKPRIRYMNAAEFSEWVCKMTEEENQEKIGTGLTVYCWSQVAAKQDGTLERFVENLEIGINKDAFHIDGESYEALISLVVEHELQEAWLNTKKGRLGNGGDQEALHTRHLLAEQKEFLLAEKTGLGEKLFQWRMKICPDNEDEYRMALESAKKKMRARTEHESS